MAMKHSLRWLLLASVCLAVLSSTQGKRTVCLREQSFVRVSILGGMEAGNFVNLGTARDINDCLNKACNTHKGNIAFLLRKTCFSVICNNMQSCELEAVDGAGTNTAGALYRIIEAYPVFKNAPKVVFVDEDTPAGTDIIRLEVAAESRESDKEMMSLKLETGNIGKTFHLHPKLSNRRVLIRLQKLVDREKIPSYPLTIKATNKVENVSTLFNITINVTDVNDNPPVFVKSLFVFNVFSNMSVGATIGRLVAKDKDIGKNAELTYTLTTASYPVILHPSTGVVTLKSKPLVDTVETYQYTVTASDGFYTIKSRLKVEVYPNNINRPTFDRQEYKVRLNGQAPSDTDVCEVWARDSDFGQLGELTFQITNGNEDRTFYITRIRRELGVIKIKKRIPLEKYIYNLTINVRDNGYPELYALNPVHVIILVQRLRFKHDRYETAVQEDLPVRNAVLFTVNASLWDGGTELMNGQQQRTQRGIKYYFDNVKDLDDFELGETTGIITLKKNLDYENRKVYELELRAEYTSSDTQPRRSLLTAKATLSLQVLDVNDNAPKFHNLFYSQDVWKSSKVNSPILRINATDADTGVNGLIQFVAISGNINNTFFFQSDGMVFLRKSLLQTKVTMFNITIAAMDKGTPKQQSSRTAVVIIRVQGFRPYRPLFGKGSYSAIISESVPINENILEVKASVYQGKSRVNYWIRNSKQNLPFRVDSNSGCVRTTQKLDREKKDVYVLTIVASTDLGEMNWVNATITLKDENDNSPIFTHHYFSTILSSHKVGTKVLSAKATDNDVGRNAKILYKIIKSHDEKYFTINSSSGLITTKRLLPTKSLTVLKCFILAEDQGKPSLSSSKNVPVFVVLGSTFPITVRALKKTTSQILLRFTMSNVSLDDVSHFGVVVQEYDKIADYEKITKRRLNSWFYVHNAKGNGVYAQRYLTGKVRCTDLIKKTKTFEFNVGADGNKCQSDKRSFCNGKLQAEKKYRFQLAVFFKNKTLPENVTSVESEITPVQTTGANNANRSAGFRSNHYDVIVIVVGILVALIIIAAVSRAIMLYRRDTYRIRKDEAKDGISYPLSNPRYQRAGEQTPSSRSTLSFTELSSKSKKNDRRSEKVSPDETEKLEIIQDESGGVSRDSGCGVSVKSSNSDINQRRTPSVRRALFSFGKKDEEEEEQEEEEEEEEKEIETELNT